MSVEMQTVKVNQTANRKDPVKKGAKIGAGTALGLMGTSFLINSHKLKKTTGDGFFKTINKGLNEAVELFGDKKVKSTAIAASAVTAAIVLAGVSAISAGIGAGIGKLVKNHNEKKEAEKQEIVNQVKTELIEDAIN